MMTWPQWENPECWNELIMKKAFEAVDSERTAKSIGFNWIYTGEITSKQAVMSVNFTHTAWLKKACRKKELLFLIGSLVMCVSSVSRPLGLFLVEASTTVTVSFVLRYQLIQT